MTFFFEERLSDIPFVEKVWQTQSEHDVSFISQAASQWEMVVTKYQGKTTLMVRGPETKASPANCPAGVEFLGIVFKLGVFMPHLPLTRRLDRNDISLPEATNQTFWLNGSAWQFPNYNNADTFVERLVRQGLLMADPVVEATLQGHPPAVSSRTIQYRFLRATGLPLNTIQQIERARQALTLLRQGTPILDAVYEAGYFDQPHLTRSLKRFIGQTPTQIAGTTIP